MDSLTALAFDSYVETGIEGALRLSVPPHVIAERLTVLHQLVAPGSRERALLQQFWRSARYWLEHDALGLEEYFEHLIRQADAEEWGADEGRYTDDEAQFEVRIGERGGNSAQVEASAANEGGTSTAPETPVPDVLELITNKGQHGLARGWEFHKGDADPYPSVPHGHERRDRQTRDWPKLDVYRGYVFDESGAELKRESRRAIVALWNDAKFRTFAREALNHALNNDTTLARRLLDERGVRSPHLLPGERSRRGR